MIQQTGSKWLHQLRHRAYGYVQYQHVARKGKDKAVPVNLVFKEGAMDQFSCSAVSGMICVKAGLFG